MNILNLKQFSTKFNFFAKNSKKEKTNFNSEKKYNTSPAFSYPQNYYFLSFEARVDKNLNSFYSRNINNMPLTFKNYVDSLTPEERNTQTPMVALKNAFELLEICDSVEDIKMAFDDEPLFKNLKSANDSKATKGLLYDMRIMNDDIGETDECILKDNQDLTVYLVKKLFLEDKTIDEINQDLDKDLHEVFRTKEKKYISSSTISSLGISIPKEFAHSLRYTKDGYSDRVGENIRLHYVNLTPEEKKELILKRASSKRPQQQKESPSNLNKPETNRQQKSSKKHIVTQQTREKQRQARIASWERLSPEEKTKRIEELTKGSKRTKTALISAWNKCPSARQDLSRFLIENHFNNPESIIYATNSLQQPMKVKMTAFWNTYPQHAKELGEAISLSFDEYDEAEANNKLKEYVTKVRSEQHNIKKSIIEDSKKIHEEIKTSKRDALENFRQMFSFLPKDILNTQLKKLKEINDPEVTELWTRYCMGEELSQWDKLKAQEIQDKVFPSKSNESQAFISAAILEINDCLKEITNPKTGKSFKPVFPINKNFRFADITSFYFEAKRKGYKKVNLHSDFSSEPIVQTIMERNPQIGFNMELMNSYDYGLKKEPNFDNINENYSKFVSKRVDGDKLIDMIFTQGANPVWYNSLKKGIPYQSSIYQCLEDETNSNLPMLFRIYSDARQMDENHIQDLEKRVLSDYESQMIEVLGQSKEEMINSFKQDFSFLPKSLLQHQLRELRKFTPQQIALWSAYCHGKTNDIDKDPQLAKISVNMFKTDSSNKVSNNLKGLNGICLDTFITSLTYELDKCTSPIINSHNGKEFHVPIDQIYDYSLDFGKMTGIIYDYLNGKTDGSELFIQGNAYKQNSLLIQANPDKKFDIEALKNTKIKLDKTPDFAQMSSIYDEISTKKLSKSQIDKLTDRLTSNVNPGTNIKKYINSILSYSPHFATALVDERFKNVRNGALMTVYNIAKANCSFQDNIMLSSNGPLKIQEEFEEPLKAELLDKMTY